MTNAEIADHLSMLAKMMDLHGENAFKSKTYSNAAFQIEKLETDLAQMPPQSIAGVWGIGQSVAQKIQELLEQGSLALLNEYVANTPEGVLQMMQIKGIGPKKIHIIWKEMEIETLGELLYACNENRLTLYKGFGQKTQDNIRDSINFFLSQQGLFLYQQAEPIAAEIYAWLATQFGNQNVCLTGDFLQQADIIEQIEFLIAGTAEELDAALENNLSLSVEAATENTFTCGMVNGPNVVFHCCTPESFVQQLFLSSGSAAFNDAFLAQYGSAVLMQPQTTNDQFVFESAGITFVPPYLRHSAHALELAINQKLPTTIAVAD
ncbi:MAG: DNA polymerase/3'-5' exonuclease PolX, partial [Bacteroidetes bacterium]